MSGAGAVEQPLYGLSTGLTLTRQAPASAVATVDVDDTPPADLWQEIATEERFQRTVIEAVRDRLAGTYHTERADVLQEAGVTAANGGVATVLTGLDLPPEHDRHQDALDLIGAFGQPTASIIGHLSLDVLDETILPLLEANSRTPTVAVRLPTEFRDQRASQRRAICQLVATLASACDVRLICSGLTAAWLRRTHREDLPGVSPDDTAQWDTRTVSAAVETARDALNPTGRPVALLRELVDEHSGTCSRHELRSTLRVGRSRLSQLLNGEGADDIGLVDLELVALFDGADGPMVELTPAGSAYVEFLDSEIGRQQRLEDVAEDGVRDTGNPSDDSRVSHAYEGAQVSQADRRRLPHLHCVRRMSRWNAAAATATAPAGGVGLADYPAERKADRAEPEWYYDEAADRLVVAAEYDAPMPFWTCIARALADRRTWETILTAERLDDEDGEFATLLQSHRHILRASRCLGHLPDRIQSGEDYADALVDARDSLGELTKRYHNGDFDDRNSFRGVITRDALGLYGTMVHLLDLCDVDVVIEARIPRFSQDFKQSQREDLATTIAKGVAIGSRYGHFTAQRSLFEPRDDKRRGAIFPDVDAADPHGECIPSFSLVGPSVDQLADSLHDELAAPGDLQDDAPEFAVRVPVEQEGSRRAVYQALREAGQHKNIRPTREAVTLFEAFAATPYDVVDAIYWLGVEDNRRDIHVDEVRLALSNLDASRLCPGMAPTVQAVITALLEAETPLIQSDLADAADVSARSVRTHRETFAAIDVVRETPEGYRLALSFKSERDGADVLPQPVTDDNAAPRDGLVEVAHSVLDDPTRLADPDDPVGGALHWPPDIEQLLDELPDLRPWYELLRRLCEVERAPETVVFGAELEQTSIATPGGVSA